MKDLKNSPEEYVKMLIKLEKKGRDGFGDLANIALVALGATGGAAAAPLIAGAAGATAITGVSWLASAMGFSFVAATPVGWIAGCAAGGGALAYGLGKLARKCGAHDERRRKLKENIWQKISEFKMAEETLSEQEQFKNVIVILHMAELHNYFDRSEGIEILKALKDEEISPSRALIRCEKLLEAIRAGKRR